MLKAWHGSIHSQLQHSEGWDRGIIGQIGLHSKFEANLDYIARFCLKKRKKTNRSIDRETDRYK